SRYARRVSWRESYQERQLPGREKTDDGPVGDVGEHGDDGGGAAVVQQHEAGRLQQRRLPSGRGGRAHARVHGGEEHVDEGRAREERVEQAEGGAREPAGVPEGEEDHPVAGGEDETEEEVQRVADDLGACP